MVGALVAAYSFDVLDMFDLDGNLHDDVEAPVAVRLKRDVQLELD